MKKIKLSKIQKEIKKNPWMISTLAGVSGYPTTKINGEAYSGARTIAGLADATGCQAPDIEGIGELANINADAEPAAPAAGCGA